MDPPQQPSSYLDYLPAIFRQDPFLGRFLLAFETMLSGTGPDRPGLQTTIDGIADYFDPEKADPDFLPWLAGWVSLSLRADWDTDTRREFIRDIVPLYRLRGTRSGLLRMLTLYTREPVEVFDRLERPDFFFEVKITLLGPKDPEMLQTKADIARAIIDQEKPAHTFYALQVAVPMMRLVSEEQHEEFGWEMLTLGKNTTLGTEPVSGLKEDPWPIPLRPPA
jgi:phage tail-like protein